MSVEQQIDYLEFRKIHKHQPKKRTIHHGVSSTGYIVPTYYVQNSNYVIAPNPLNKNLEFDEHKPVEPRNYFVPLSLNKGKRWETMEAMRENDDILIVKDIKKYDTIPKVVAHNFPNPPTVKEDSNPIVYMNRKGRQVKHKGSDKPNDNNVDRVKLGNAKDVCILNLSHSKKYSRAIKYFRCYSSSYRPKDSYVNHTRKSLRSHNIKYMMDNFYL